MADNIAKPITTEEVPTVTEPVQELAENGNPKEPQGYDWQALNDNYLQSPLFHEVVQYFGIPQEEWDGAKNELSMIVDYITEYKNSPRLEDVLTGIRELEDAIQPPQWGEKRYKNLYRYIRLAGKQLALKKAMSAFERKGGSYGK
jgi:hypothetical protein